jgi:phage protein D
MTVNTDTYVPDFKIKVNGRTFIHGTTVDIISVSITETTNRSDSFSISVREHNPEPGRFAGNALTWLDDRVFDEGGEIKIEMGYQNNRAVKLHGYITGMNADFPDSGAPRLTVTGQSYYQQIHRRTSRKPFDAKTDGDIARAIAADLKLKADIEEINLEHPLVSPEGATYAAILQDRAAAVLRSRRQGRHADLPTAHLPVQHQRRSDADVGRKP